MRKSITCKDWIRAAIFVALILPSAVAAFGQAEASPDLYHTPERFRTAANKWRLTPIDVQSQPDQVPLAVRQARDAFADKFWGKPLPLSVERKSNFGIGEAIGLPPAGNPEFPTMRPENFWVIAKFEGYSTLLSSTQRCIYTEIHYRIQHVFDESAVSHRFPDAREGGQIEALIGGGTIRAPWGKTISYSFSPQAYAPQPGHTYLLLFVSHDPNIYLEQKRWDLTSGAVEAESPDEKLRATQGRSAIAGMTVSQLTTYMEDKLRAGR
jgi:hypothetical protein